MPIMDLVINEEFTKMYSDEELLGARRIQARKALLGGISCIVLVALRGVEQQPFLRTFGWRPIPPPELAKGTLGFSGTVLCCAL